MPTLAQIRTKVLAYMIDQPASAVALVDGWINAGIGYAERQHNFRHMEALLEMVTVEETRVVSALPSGWKENRADPWRTDAAGATREIEWLPSENEAVRIFHDDSTGTPAYLLERNGNIEAWPLPDGNADHDDGEYRISAPYWKYSPDLAADGESNWLTENGLDFVLNYAVYEAMIFLREEERAAVYLRRAGVRDPSTGRTGGYLGELIRVDKGSRLSRRINLKPRSGVFGSTVSRRAR